jgi:hypothetical protein
MTAPGGTAAGRTIDPDVIGRGIGARLRQLGAALRRYDAFVFRPGVDAGPAAPPEDGQPAAARAQVLRALRACADASGWQILARLAGGDATSGELGTLLRCPRLTAWDQVNELVQAGLAARDLETDAVGLTAAGRGMVDLVEALTASAAAASGPAAELSAAESSAAESSAARLSAGQAGRAQP